MARSGATRLYLIRHGETDWNRAQRLQGLIDVPLNEAGTAQAHQIAARVAMLPLACIVSSPLARAWATAVTIARVAACPLRADARLREVEHGSWSGLTLTEIGHRFPSLVGGDRLLPDAFDLSGGERLDDVRRRVSAILADLLAECDGLSVAVVGHGVALALMICAATRLDAMRFNEHLPPNASITCLTFLKSRLVVTPAAGVPRLTPINSEVQR
jgi:broad specificity phosphatase PhoE